MICNLEIDMSAVPIEWDEQMAIAHEENTFKRWWDSLTTQERRLLLHGDIMEAMEAAFLSGKRYVQPAQMRV